MKPRVGIFSLSSCEGCQLQILNMEEELLDLVQAIDLVSFREAMDPISGEYDIALVEGAVTRESEIPVLQEIRRKADVLVAMGACAAAAGVIGLRNLRSPEENLRRVYGEHPDVADDVTVARPLDEVVEVDYYIRSCPIDRDEFLHLIKSLLMGKEPYDPNYPVCVECRIDENVCLYDLNDGEFCQGPVTRAGCGALCPGFGSACMGCRGLVDDANVESMIDIMVEAGIDEREARRRLELFHAGPEGKKNDNGED